MSDVYRCTGGAHGRPRTLRARWSPMNKADPRVLVSIAFASKGVAVDHMAAGYSPASV
jgi:hypothetical protein